MSAFNSCIISFMTVSILDVNFTHQKYFIMTFNDIAKGQPTSNPKSIYESILNARLRQNFILFAYCMIGMIVGLSRTIFHSTHWVGTDGHRSRSCVRTVAPSVH